MNKIEILIGISGSGKSTYAKAQVLGYPTKRVVSRDKIRELSFGYDESNINEYYKLPSPSISSNEKFVSTIQTTLIRQYLAQGYDVIVDNTHLDKKYINEIIDLFPQCEISFRLFEIEWEKALLRVNNRVRKVEQEIILKQYQQLQKLKQSFDFSTISPRIEKYIPDETLPVAFICDIDGTISDYKGHREAFGFKSELIELDRPIPIVINDITNLIYQNNIFPIFITGREEKYEKQTREWLTNNLFLAYSEYLLFMRPKGDFRKDNVFKLDIFNNHIRNNYNVITVFEDRPTMVSLYQELGIFTFNVNQSVKEF